MRAHGQVGPFSNFPQISFCFKWCFLKWEPTDRLESSQIFPKISFCSKEFKESKLSVCFKKYFIHESQQTGWTLLKCLQNIILLQMTFFKWKPADWLNLSKNVLILFCSKGFLFAQKNILYRVIKKTIHSILLLKKCCRSLI